MGSIIGVIQGETRSLYYSPGTLVPVWVCYGFLLRDYNLIPQKEIVHRKVWVGFRIRRANPKPSSPKP